MAVAFVYEHFLVRLPGRGRPCAPKLQGTVQVYNTVNVRGAACRDVPAFSLTETHLFSLCFTVNFTHYVNFTLCENETSFWFHSEITNEPSG